MLRSLKTIIYYSFKVGSQQTFVLLKTSFILVFKRRLQDVLIKTNIFALLIRLQKTSWSRPIYSSWSYVFKTCSRRFQDVFKTSCQDDFKTSSRHFEDVFKTFSRRLQDILLRRFEVIFKTSSKRLAKTSSRHLQDVFKTFWKRHQDPFKTYHWVNLFLFSRFQDVFETFSKRF